MKLIILAMSCDIPFFVKEEQLVKETWAKDVINNKYPDTSFYFIRTSLEERIEGNYIYVNTGDDIVHTMEKNIRAFELLKENNIEFDFLLRTNLSTYINVPIVRQFLLYECLPNFQYYNNTIFTSQVVSSFKKSGPRGNFLLINRGIINSLIYLYRSFYQNLSGLDDSIIGNILYPIIYYRTVFCYELFKDERYSQSSYIDNINNINVNCFFVVYRYYTPATQSGYYLREKYEFETCRKVHEHFLLNNTEDVDINLNKETTSEKN